MLHGTLCSNVAIDLMSLYQLHLMYEETRNKWLLHSSIKCYKERVSLFTSWNNTIHFSPKESRVTLQPYILWNKNNSILEDFPFDESCVRVVNDFLICTNVYISNNSLLLQCKPSGALCWKYVYAAPFLHTITSHIYHFTSWFNLYIAWQYHGLVSLMPNQFKDAKRFDSLYWAIEHLLWVWVYTLG